MTRLVAHKIVLVLFFGSARILQAEAIDRELCGVQCLYVALRSLDAKVEGIGKLQSDAGPPPPGGYSLGKLEQVAKRYVKYQAGVQTDLDGLRRLGGRFACIAHVRPNHFVVLADIGNDTVTIIDPPTRRKVPFVTWSTQWDGRALLLSDERIHVDRLRARRSGPWFAAFCSAAAVLLASWAFIRRRAALRLSVCAVACAVAAAGCTRVSSGPPILICDRDVIDLGEVHVGAMQSTDIRLTNVGDSDALIKAIRTSCTCANVSYSQSAIGKGDAAVITIRTRPKASGPNAARVSIESTSFVSPVQSIEVRWNAIAPVQLLERVVDLGNVRQGEERSHEVVIESHEVDASKMPLVTKAQSLHGSLVYEGALPMPLENRTIAGRVHLSSECHPGRHFGQVKFSLANCDIPELSLTLVWTVVPEVEVLPSGVSFGSVFGGSECVRHVVLRFRDAAAAKASVTWDCQWITAQPVQAALETQKVLSLRARAPSNPGIHTGHLIVELPHPSTVVTRVPISITVKPGVLGDEAKGTVSIDPH